MKKNKLPIYFLSFILSNFVSNSLLSQEEDENTSTLTTRPPCSVQQNPVSPIQKRSPKRNINSMGINKIETIPLELLFEICYKLAPKDISNLASSSQSLKEKITDKFWERYLKINHQERWSRSSPAIKVAYAYSLFHKGKIEQAAQLGFPKAIRIIEDRKDSNKKRVKKSSFRKKVIKKITSQKFLILFLCHFPSPSPFGSKRIMYHRTNKTKGWTL